MPLLGLFTELRQQADLPLGVDEYLQMVQALQAGFGIDPQGIDHSAALRRLCYILWTNSLQEQRKLDYYFDLMLQERQIAQDRTQTGLETAARPTGETEQKATQDHSTTTGDEIREPTRKPQETIQEPDISGPGMAGPAIEVRGEPGSPTFTPESIAKRHLESALAQPGLVLDVGQAARSMQAVLPESGFILTGEHLPVTSRQMKQTWRHLRSLVRSGPRVVLNIHKTVEKIARDGLLVEPVLEPRRANRIELLLLVDRLGSMAPFHILADLLVESAQKGGRLAQAGVYYFNNVPRDRLYLTPALVKAHMLDAILSRLHQERTVALIFSDGGAARRHNVPERVALTAAFLRRLNGSVRRVAWVNPMPKERWPDTSAEDIARLALMFPFSRKGLDDAIDALRGRGSLQLSSRGMP